MSHIFGGKHLPWTIAIYCAVANCACGDDQNRHGAVTSIRESLLIGDFSQSIICLFIKWEQQSRVFFLTGPPGTHQNQHTCVEVFRVVCFQIMICDTV